MHDTDINVTFKKGLSEDVMDVIADEIDKTFTADFLNFFFFYPNLHNNVI